MQSIHIIANPVAGGGLGRRRALQLREALAGRGLSATLFETAQAGDARAEASRVDTGTVAVVGGDGTLNEVLNGLPSPGSARLALLPVGTANVVARELGMSPDPARAVEAIAGGHLRAMDVGMCGDRRFLLGAGAGLDAAIVHAVQRQRGRRSSLLKWVGPALAHALRPVPDTIAVTVDGEPVGPPGGYVIVGNCRYSAGVFPATPLADTADGLLDVCVLSGITPARLLMLMARVWRPGFMNARGVTYRQGRRIALVATAGSVAAPLQIDGDPAGAIPATFTVHPERVRMVVPAGR